MMRRLVTAIFPPVVVAGSTGGNNYRSAADTQQQSSSLEIDSPPPSLTPRHPFELNESWLENKTEERTSGEQHTVSSLLSACQEKFFPSSSPADHGGSQESSLEAIGRSVAASEQNLSHPNRAADRIALCARALFPTTASTHSHSTVSSISRLEFESIVADVQERVEDRDLVEEVLDNLRPSHKRKKEEAKKKKNSLPSIPLSKNIAANLPPNDPRWDSLRAKFCCVICQDVMVFPMVVTCGHSFCGECNSPQSLFFLFIPLITLFICFLLQRFGRLYGLAACGGDLLSRVPLQYLLWGGDL